MMGKTAKRLIIVCDEKTKDYANYLRQLISLNDDKDGEVVGIADGSVEAAVWTDKEYLANSAKVSSSEHVLFIGENKVSKSEISSMITKFDKFGMKYGWLGKRGMLTVDNELLAPEEYDEFISFCGGYETQFEKIVMKRPKMFNIGKKDSEPAAIEAEDNDVVDTNDVVVAEEPIDKKPKTGLALGLGVAAGAVGGVVAGAGALLSPVVAAGAVGVYKGVSQVTVHKKVKDQQYRALTAIMYMDALTEFMEG